MPKVFDTSNIYILLSIIYTIWLFNIAMENPLQMKVLMGKSSINGPFSMAMLNNQRVYISNSTDSIKSSNAWRTLATSCDYTLLVTSGYIW